MLISDFNPKAFERNLKRTTSLAISAAVISLALLASIPAHATTAVSGPLGGSCASSTGKPNGVETDTLTSSDGAGNTITYTVESGCLIKGSTVGDVAVVAYFVSASCNTAACPATATIGSTVTPAAHSNNQAKGASATINIAVASGLTVSIATNGAAGTPVKIFSGQATLNSFPTHGRHSNTVALFGSVDVSAGGLFSVASPDFSVAWHK
jgi:hypothetical protein